MSKPLKNHIKNINLIFFKIKNNLKNRNYQADTNCYIDGKIGRHTFLFNDNAVFFSRFLY
jgi:hypothetical protein